MPSFERTTADTFLIITARNISFLPQKLGFTVAHLFITIGHYSPNSTCQVLSQLAADTAPLAIFSGHLIGHILLLIGSSSLTAEMKSQSNYKPVCVAGTSDPQLFREFHSICSSLETPENLHFKYNRSLPRLRSSRKERVGKRARSRLWYIFGLMNHAVRLSFLYSCLCVCRPVRSYNLPHISFCMCVQYYQGKVFGDWHKVIDTLTMVPTIVAFDWLFSPVQSLTFLFLSFFFPWLAWLQVSGIFPGVGFAASFGRDSIKLSPNAIHPKTNCSGWQTLRWRAGFSAAAEIIQSRVRREDQSHFILFDKTGEERISGPAVEGGENKLLSVSSEYA